jgi:hypothetical protein
MEPSQPANFNAISQSIEPKRLVKRVRISPCHIRALAGEIKLISR